jgi:hypothetical protein
MISITIYRSVKIDDIFVLIVRYNKIVLWLIDHGERKVLLSYWEIVGKDSWKGEPLKEREKYE